MEEKYLLMYHVDAPYGLGCTACSGSELASETVNW
jgi:hypothetical protein